VKEKRTLTSIFVPHKAFDQKQNSGKFTRERKKIPQIGRPKSYENQIDKSPWRCGEPYILP
jgi:hypothetical protein